MQKSGENEPIETRKTMTYEHALIKGSGLTGSSQKFKLSPFDGAKQCI